MQEMITKDIEIEELVRVHPFSVQYLMKHNIKCIACGEPIWGTLAEAASEKGYNEEELERFVADLNEMAKIAH
jgi:methionine synthase II (cobalamin-independent)